MMPIAWQPDYSIPRYITLTSAPDSNYNEPFLLTNGDNEEEPAAALPNSNITTFYIINFGS